MYPKYLNSRPCLLCMCIWFNLLGKSFLFPSKFQDKRFNIEAVPVENGKILLHLKSRYGSTGTDGPMGDRGPVGTPGLAGPQGDQGDPGFCPVEMCDAMQKARSLVSRVEALEYFVKHRSFHSDQTTDAQADSPVMALHIISDILLTKANFSNGKIPSKVNVNIALKNTAPVIATGSNGGKFLVNSTVQLLDRSKIKGLQRGYITKTSVPDGVAMTEQQFQKYPSGFQQEVQSIKKNR